MKTYEQWLEEYDGQIVTNAIRKDAEMDGFMFETFGAEEDFVTAAMSDPRFYIWTIGDGDDGRYLSPGKRFVNRVGFLITKKPPKDDVEDYVIWTDDEFDED